MELHGKKAELHQYSEIELPEQEEPRHVKIRGYNDHNRKAVHMEGMITPSQTYMADRGINGNPNRKRPRLLSAGHES